MASSCCGTKKQRLSNSDEEKHNNPTMNGYGNQAGSSCTNNHCDPKHDYSKTNGHANTNGHAVVPMTNGLSNGYRDRIASTEMGYYCFDVLYSNLHNCEPPKMPNFTNEAFPLFVTWKIGKDYRLRGCMGTFNAMHLHSGLREYAITSAFKDSRFPPISREEFPKLHCSVSILCHFEEAADYLDWEVGVHGIRIEFLNEKGAKRTATYLPEVAREQGWNQTQTIDSLLRKGGYKGNVTPDVRASIKLTRYQSEKIALGYQEYANRWNTSNGHARAY